MKRGWLFLLCAAVVSAAMMGACSPPGGETAVVTWAGGTLDASFDPGAGPDNNEVTCLAVQPDGKILTGGNFTSFDGDAGVQYFVRLASDGSRDATFATGLNATVSNVEVQGDGKVLIGGNFTFNSGTQYNHILRLNADGSVDPTFNIGSGAASGTTGWVRSMALQGDGKVLIGGWFDQYNGENRNRLARIATNGLLDATFTDLVGAVTSIEAIAVQADGRVVVGGVFTTIGGQSRNNIARLNADGTLDATFDPGTGAGPINACAVQADGKVLIGGNFVTVNGVERSYIARLNADGSLDATFNGGAETGANNQVRAIAVQGDGKIVIAGEFTQYNGTSVNGVARLDPDGALDAAFTPGSGPDAAVSALAFQAIGNERRLLIGGAFTHYDGIARSRVARIE